VAHVTTLNTPHQADAKLFVQQHYNRVVPAAPSLRTAPTVVLHLMGRLFYLGTTFVWPWLVFGSVCFPQSALSPSPLPHPPRAYLRPLVASCRNMLPAISSLAAHGEMLLATS
jgi:hypothetical protein